MTSDDQYRDAPGSVPTKLGRGGLALREAVHRLVAPYFEQARLRTEEVRAETAALRDDLAAVRSELAALRASSDDLRGALAEARSSADEAAEEQARRHDASERGAAEIEERLRGAELELRAVTRRLADAVDAGL